MLFSLSSTFLLIASINASHFSHPSAHQGLTQRSISRKQHSRNLIKTDLNRREYSGDLATVLCKTSTTWSLCSAPGVCTFMGPVAPGTLCVDNAILSAVGAGSPSTDSQVESNSVPVVVATNPVLSPTPNSEPTAIAPVLIEKPISITPTPTSITAPSPSASVDPVTSEDDGEDCDVEGDDSITPSSTIEIVATPAATVNVIQAAIVPSTSASSSSSSAAATPFVSISVALPTLLPTPTSSSSSTPSPSTTPAPASGNGVQITGGKGTFYNQEGGYGACGKKYTDSDFIVALAIGRYGTGSNNAPDCGKTVTVTNTANGKSVKATVADACPGCANYNSLDLSVAAFDAIALASTGVIDISYVFDN